MTAELLIEEAEGYRQFPYMCTAGKLTIGIGFNLDDVGLSNSESKMILMMRLGKLAQSVRVKYDWFHKMSETRQAVVLSMVYQLGEAGFSKFKNMIAALEVRDYAKAADESLDSKFARQTPNRAERQAKLMRNG